MANKPNNPSLWSKAKSLARQKFDVYPSAYANGWAAKWYKGKGGTWRKAAFGMEIPDPGTGRATPPGLTPRQMEEWNRLVDFIGTKGYAGSKELDVRSKGLGRQLFDEFRAANPDVSIDYNIVPLAQREFLGFQKQNEGFKNRRGITRGDQFDRLSKEDAWLGSFTSQQKFIPLIEQIQDPSGRIVSQINKGLINAQGIPSSMRDASGNQLGFIRPPGAVVEQFSDGQYYIEDPKQGYFIPVQQYVKQGNKFLYEYGGGMTTGDISIPSLPVKQRKGGYLPTMQNAGQCPEGFIFLEEVGDCVPLDMFGPGVSPTRGMSRSGIELSYPKFSLGYNYSSDPFGRRTHDMKLSLPQAFGKRGALNLSGNYTPGQSWMANLDSDFRFGKRDAERAPRLTLNASVDKFFGDPELSQMSRMERLLPPQKALNYNIEAGLNIPLRKEGNLRISGSYGKRAMKYGGWLDEYKNKY